jgi:uncharacterized protein YecE (DUF72 family)
VDVGLKRYFKIIGPLKEHLGPILWQLPPNLHLDIPRLDEFAKKLPKKFQHAIEFRHPSWFCEETFSVLRKHHIANTWLSSAAMPMDFTITANFIYLRFHGLEDGAAHDYTESELKPWVKQLIAAAKRGIDAYVYFNNDWNTRAPLNAKLLMEMTGKLTLPPFDVGLPRTSRHRKNVRIFTKPDFSLPRSRRLRLAKHH